MNSARSSLFLVFFTKLSSLGMQNSRESILAQRRAPFSSTHFEVFLGQISLSQTLNLNLPFMIEVDLTEGIRVYKMCLTFVLSLSFNLPSVIKLELKGESTRI